EFARGRRRLRVRAAADRRVHVGLDLGGGQGVVVDADLVDQPGEVLAPHRVAADPQRVGGGGDAAGLRRAADLGAVDVQEEGGAVVGGGQVAPGVQRQHRGAGRADVGAAAVDVAGGRLTRPVGG